MSLITSAIRRLGHALVLALDPLRFRQAMLMRAQSASIEDKIEFDASPRPHFAYGVYKAAD